MEGAKKKQNSVFFFFPFLNYWTFESEAHISVEIFEGTDSVTRRHVPKDLNVHIHNSGNFMSFIPHMYISLTQVNELNF